MRIRSIYAVCGLLVVFLAMSACNTGGSKNDAGDTAAAKPHGHHHHHHGLHGGHIVELDTPDFHAEVAHDDEAKRVDVYLLNASGSAEVALPIDSIAAAIVVTEDEKPTEYKLTAAAPEAGADAKVSQFSVESEPLYEIITSGVLRQNPPELRLTIDGKTFTGTIEDPHARPLIVHGPHSDGPDHTLVWPKELKEDGYEFSLGHHGVILMAGAQVEPAVQIKKDGEPVADAKVFNALLAGDGSTVLAEEVATVYEPPTEEEPAHYAQGALKIPPGTREATLRFRIILPENAGERTFDVPVAVQ